MISTRRSPAGRTLCVFVALSWVCGLTAVGQSPPTMDGNLSDFKALVQQIQSQGLHAVGIYQLDNYANAVPVGPQGFCDEPLNDTASPSIPIALRMYSPVNVGDFYWIYKPDSDGIIDPNLGGVDDSWMAVGINIANGDGDVAQPDQCGRPEGPPILPSWIMVPFDCDGNGEPGKLGFNAQCRWFPDSNIPVDSFDEVKDAIDLAFRFCQSREELLEDDRAAPEFEFYYSQQYDLPTEMHVFIKGIDIPVGNFGTIQAFPPIHEPNIPVIMDGGDGICSSAAVGDDVQFITQFAQVRAPGVVILPGPNGTIQSVPAGDDILTRTSPITLRGLQPNFGFADGLSNNDIEFYIPQIDTAVTNQLLPSGQGLQDYYTKRMRFFLATSRLDLRSESSGDLSAEDTMLTLANLAIPELEVTKEVRCVQTGDPCAPNPWTTSVDALPGSAVEFRITVENTGNIPLTVTLTDVLQTFGSAGFTVDPNFLQATYFPYGGAGEPVVFPSQIPTGLSAPFFNPKSVQGFLAGVNSGQPKTLGILRAVQACAASPTPGDKLELIFRATFTMPDCNGFLAVDAKNSITASGADPNVPAVTLVTDAPGLVPHDPNNGVDTLRERLQTYDDNVVNVNVLCRGLTFTKDVALGAGCNDPNAFTDQLNIPPDANYPLSICFRYTVKNTGEVSELVTISDSFLCTEANDPANGIHLDTCDVCPGGDPNNVVDPNQTYRAFCRVRFDTKDALELFLTKDDGSSRPCPSAEPPGVTSDYCYSNCATLTASATELGDVCDDGPTIELKDYATVCSPPCQLTVTKQVECIGRCSDPNEPNTYASAVNVVRGSAVRFRIDIQNTSPAPTDCVGCRLTIVDTMGRDANNPTIDPNQITLCSPSNVRFWLFRREAPTTAVSVAVPAGFNVNGAAFNWDPNSPGFRPGDPNHMGQGDRLVITYDARIPEVADPNKDAMNIVSDVQAYVSCPNGNPAFGRTGLPAVAIVDIKRVEMSCSKKWAVEWDKDANCDPNGGFIDYSNSIDLGTADGGQAIIFPARLCMLAAVQNIGEVPLDVTVTDPNFCTLVNNTAGVHFVDPNSCNVCTPHLTTQTIPAFNPADPNASIRTWSCCILVDTADAMRRLAQNDGGSNAGVFENMIIANGTPVGVCSGSGVQTTCTATITPPPPCSFTVTKDVRCRSTVLLEEEETLVDPNSYQQHATALPGSLMTFRIRIRNTSAFVKLPHLCITDLLSDPNWAVASPQCAAKIGVDPNAAGTNVTACVCPLNTTGARSCCTFLTCRPAAPWIAPGETLTITFNVQAPLGGVPPADPNCPHTTPDLTNTVTVEGYTEACPLTPDPNTACAKQTAFADVRKLVPAIDCDKDVRVDFNNDGTYDTSFDPNLVIACDANFPLTLQWRVTATNYGEVNLTNVRVCDDQLIADAAAAGLTLVSCDFSTPIACDGQSLKCKALSDLLPCHGTASAVCAIRVPSRAAWLAFAGATGCYTNTAVVCGDASDANVCMFGATTGVTSACSAQVCIRPPCNITVDKKLRCLTPPLQAFTDGPLSVMTGADVEFQITAKNIDTTGFSPTVCAFRVTDLMDPNALTLIPARPVTAQVIRDPNVVVCTFTPAGFNIGGAPCTIIPPAACNPLQTGDRLVITFGARVQPAAAGVITNTATVEGAADCPAAAAPTFCCSATDNVTLNVKQASLLCISKMWSVQWDKNANCVLDPNDALIDYDPNINLETADNGKAIVFPAKLCARIQVKNTGEVPLRVRVTDPNFCALVNSTLGVSFTPDVSACEICGDPNQDAKILDPNATGSWTCCIKVDSADAMRRLALNDGGVDANWFENRAIAYATIPNNDPNYCVPLENEQIPIQDSGTDCYARIKPPPPCEILVTKQVQCINCTTGLPEPNTPAPADTLAVAPGSCARFIITAQNMSTTVRIPRVRIEDDALPPGWLKSGTCHATVGGVADPNVICATFNVDSIEKCYTFPWRAGTPWLDTGESLVITFDVQVPSNFGEVGDNSDLVNIVAVDAFSEVCEPNATCVPPSANDLPCSEGTDTATLDVKVPVITCEKTIAVDYGNNGNIDVPPPPTPPSDDAIMDEKDPLFVFPIRLVYTYTVENPGEVPLKDVKICDPLLVCAAASVGATVQNCGLCSGACDCIGDNCATIGPLAVGASVPVTCEVVIADKVQLLAFLKADLDGRPFSFVNEATAEGTGDFAGLCPPLDDITVESTCTARLVFVPKTSCPRTKAKVWIWNQNELLFSGTERCLIAWDDQLLTRWTDNMPSTPNSFPQTMLQTDKGHARIEGMESQVCEESVNAPLLGVATRILEVNNDPNRIAFAAAPLIGSGTEAGQLVVLPPPGRSGNAAIAKAMVQAEPGLNTTHPTAASANPLHALLGIEAINSETGRGTGSSTGVSIASVTQPGSLLAFLKVEIKWDAEGNIIQDTFLSLNNDYEESVNVMIFHVDGEPPGYPTACQAKTDNIVVLTANETTYWSAATGQPKGVSPFTVAAFRRPDPDPRNPGGTHAHGYVLAWAVNTDNQEIRWNHLTGAATVVDYKYRQVWEYGAWSFQGVYAPLNGQVLKDPYGTLDLNGEEYSWLPSMLLLDFFAPGAHLLSADGRSVTVIDTSLTLWIATNDYTQTE